MRYVDVDDDELHSYPALAEAVREQRLPLVLSGDSVRSPQVLSFAWVVQELKNLGAVE